MYPVKHLFRLFRTIYYLKPIQIRYRIYYRFKKWAHSFHKGNLVDHGKIGTSLTFSRFISESTTYLGQGSFRFLNVKVDFEESVDWNYGKEGKLWTYNLTYFQFLLQEGLSDDEGLDLIREFINVYDDIIDGLEPYPTSIRIINWIKFLSVRNLRDEEIDNILYSDILRLSTNTEYHLLGNHLIENSFALLFGGIYFQEPIWQKLANNILHAELNEQILSDGGHFELSPMYHQLMLTRILDGINLLANNDQGLIQLNFLLKVKAQLMLGWLNTVSFSDGTLPNINDSIQGIAFSTLQINDYARGLDIQPVYRKLKESGYRKFVNSVYETIVDIGNIGPDYIPGHAHSDTFNILLTYHETPILIDTGISTYEKNQVRQQERSSSAHNTVVVADIEQSEIWGGFRVGRRAKTTVIEDTTYQIKASHDGYKRLNIIHTRTFRFGKKDVVIIDEINRAKNAKAFFHFHPSISPTLNENIITFQCGVIEFEGHKILNIREDEVSLGFNLKTKTLVLEAEFTQKLITHIHLR